MQPSATTKAFKILDDLVEVRVALECQMARRAARTMGEAGLEEVRQALATLALLRNQPVDYVLADMDYHDAINRLSGNGLARSIIRSVHPHARASSRYKGSAGRPRSHVRTPATLPSTKP